MKSTVARLAGDSTPQNSDERAGKYLSFRLAKEEFAIQVLRIREIMSLQQITPVAQTPGYVKGVVSLRGKVIPVIDLRLKCGMAETEPTPRTCIIVVQVDSDKGRMLAGLVVDGVTEVLTVHSGDIEDKSEVIQSLAAAYLLGVAKIKGRLKMLLDLDLVLTAQELHDLRAAVE